MPWSSVVNFQAGRYAVLGEGGPGDNSAWGISQCHRSL